MQTVFNSGTIRVEVGGLENASFTARNFKHKGRIIRNAGTTMTNKRNKITEKHCQSESPYNPLLKVVEV